CNRRGSSEGGRSKAVFQPSRRKRAVLFERRQRERRGVVVFLGRGFGQSRLEPKPNALDVGETDALGDHILVFVRKAVSLVFPSGCKLLFEVRIDGTEVADRVEVVIETVSANLGTLTR